MSSTARTVGSEWSSEAKLVVWGIVDLPNGYSADDTLAGLVEACEQIPATMRRSVTWDCGSEMARWADLTATFDLDVWFCDPHAPWQRGLSEHTNRLIRWWLPRGLDLASSDALARIHQAQHVLNQQPRRSLDWPHPTSATMPSRADHWNSPSLGGVARTRRRRSMPFLCVIVQPGWG